LPGARVLPRSAERAGRDSATQFLKK
jgi:hypothetical protein